MPYLTLARTVSAVLKYGRRATVHVKVEDHWREYFSLRECRLKKIQNYYLQTVEIFMDLSAA
jgi:hypothetical protein